MIDTFSGIGGFSLAARWLGGIETVQFVERDPFCQRILAKHWSTIPIHDDICTFQPPPAQLTLFAVAFPAKTSAKPGRVPAWLASDRACSTNCSESFAWWDRATSCWRTSQRSLTEEWMTFSERWPRQGTTLNGRAYRQRLWAPAISVIGGGAWPTPRANSAMTCELHGQANKPNPNLETVIGRQLLTPCASDWKRRTNWEAAERHGPQRLPDCLPTGAATYLNPSFVEEMMGFPVGWTA
jgi:hypothetical protein